MSVASHGPYGPSPPSSGYTTPRFRPLPPIDAYLPRPMLDVARGGQKLDVDRVNLRCWHLPAYLLKDWYSTLVNCRWHRFYSLFLALYLAMFAAFAAAYASQPTACVTHMDNYWHALWFSVHTSSTIGYGSQAPDPDCYVLQLCIMAQVLVSLFMQGALLGLIFARISASSSRSATLRFSKALSMWVGDDGLYRLTFRVANLRRHQVLQPEARLLLLRRQLAHPFSSDLSWEYVYSELAVEHAGGGALWLGVPSLIEHRVDQRSPLFGMSEGDIKGSDMEFIALLSGVDETTSRLVEARHSYVPASIRWQHRFAPLLQRRRSGKLGVDFSRFDATAPRSSSTASLQALAAAAGDRALHSLGSSASAGPAGSAAFAAAAAAALAGAQQQREREREAHLREQRDQQQQQQHYRTTSFGASAPPALLSSGSGPLNHGARASGPPSARGEPPSGPPSVRGDG